MEMQQDQEFDMLLSVTARMERVEAQLARLITQLAERGIIEMDDDNPDDDTEDPV